MSRWNGRRGQAGKGVGWALCLQAGLGPSYGSAVWCPVWVLLSPGVVRTGSRRQPPGVAKSTSPGAQAGTHTEGVEQGEGGTARSRMATEGQ